MNVAEVEASGNIDRNCMQIERDATEHGISLTRVGIDALLNHTGEDAVVETFTFDELGRSASGVKYIILEESENDE